MVSATIILSLICFINTTSGAFSGIRGVSIQRLSFYDPLKDFTCIDGSHTVPFSYVNDDYCDCPDGTDEPGTAACPKGIFFCANKGHVSQYIPASFVNDGICDCCDGSDEYIHSNCTSLCEQLGEEARREAERQSQKITAGARLRAKLLHDAKQILQEKNERVVVLENEKAEALHLKEEAETLKKTAEERESAALEEFRAKKEAERAQKAKEDELEEQKEIENLFKTFDSNGDGELQIEEIKSRSIFDQNKDSIVSDDEVKFIEGKVDLEYFIKNVWPVLKPLVIMSNVQVYPPKDQDAHEGGEEEHEEEEEEEEEEETENKDSPEPKYDDETAKIVEAANQARSHYESALRTLQDLEREITNLKESLSKDYGSEDEFAPLDGQCFIYTDREYSYKLCPFDQVTQMSKSGGSETRLGTWAGWADKNYSKMLYDKGQSCWNGPQRSTKVVVSCGLENEVKSASEPNKCEYVLEFETPAACKLGEKSKESHDEL